MDRRAFLLVAGAAVVAPALPSQSAPVVGADLAPGLDQTVSRLLEVRRGAIREVHRVTGIPRYQLGRDGVERDTWQDQVDAGLSELVKTEAR